MKEQQPQPQQAFAFLSPTNTPQNNSTLLDKPQKRKVLKRQLPAQLKKKFKRDTQDLDNSWKPQKLSQIPLPSTSKPTLSSKGLSFLSSLSKPLNNQLSRPFISSLTKNKPKIKPVIDISNLTEEQIKYDIQDTTFLVKQFVEGAKVQQNEEDRVEQLVPVPEQYQGQDIKQINQKQLIDVNWQQKLKQKQMKLSMVDELKSTLVGLNKNNNDINFLVDEALRRTEIDEYDMAQKADSFKKKKQRYGW